MPIQRQLVVGSAQDEYEREADRVADHVMRIPEPPATTMQRACTCGCSPAVSQNETSSKEEDETGRKEDEATSLRRTATAAPPVSEAPPIVHEVLRVPGQPLDTVTRAFMAPRFGSDFGSVRVHTDSKAAESARAVNALAYTVGRNIVFQAGQYAPDSESGRHLLAHELTHVLQQNSGGDSEAVHRQPPPNPKPNPPAPAAPKFQPTVDCIVEKTNQQIPTAPKTVTVIDYGATWCGACGPAQADLIQLCNEYKAGKSKVPVHFFLVDVSDNDVKPTEKTWPPVPTSLPGLLIFSGQFETYSNQGLVTPTKAEVKKQIDKAIACAGNPLQCAIVPKDCALNPKAVPTGTRFKFDVNTDNWSSGEAARIDAFAKAIKPGSKIDILGLASSDGPDATNEVLSCHRALVAESVFLGNGLTVNSWTATGPVPGTDNKPEYRAVDIQVRAPGAPQPQPKPQPTPQPTTTGTCTPPTCVADFIISGPTAIRKGWLNKAEPDPIKRKQTADCDPSLFQIVPTSAVTPNTKILHVKWKKDPPADTLSVTRNASDNTGDAPPGKAPSFASLDPTTDQAWGGNVNGVPFRKKGCGTTTAAPAWCVPFCSFGTFTMVATVSWQCDNTVCTNDFTTKPFNIDVQPI
jgi:outer membrane protein OmpA-like peptidoglycan-associated protein